MAVGDFPAEAAVPADDLSAQDESAHPEVVTAYSGRPARIEGHTDSIASESYNQKLSERPAQSVADWLAAHDIESSRLKVVGWGENQPVAENTSAEGRQQNRRVELIIEKG